MKYEYWFGNIKGVSGKRKLEIRTQVESAEALYYIEEMELKHLVPEEKERRLILDSRKEWDTTKEYEKIQEKGIQFVTRMDQAYPKRLKQIPSPPYALYIKGKIPMEEKITAAIVGARECSAYGESMARAFGKALGQAGVPIISGMARGIDSVAQKGALDYGGTSYGVLGCGVDICYPREQIELYMKLQEQGGLISEFPVGTSPLKQNFPSRNRIISGLADLVLVIEAKEKSGSLITADMALEQGKDVYALPGAVDSALSRGCNQLIKQGADVLLSPEELIEELGISVSNSLQEKVFEKISLESAENIVYSCLGFKPKSLGDIQKMVNMPIQVLMDHLISLELQGLIREVAKNHYVKIDR